MVAGLVQLKLLLVLEFAANVRILAVGLATLVQLFILLFVKGVYLIIQVGSHLFAWVS
jgi:hypothetical protein